MSGLYCRTLPGWLPEVPVEQLLEDVEQRFPALVLPAVGFDGRSQRKHHLGITVPGALEDLRRRRILTLRSLPDGLSAVRRGELFYRPRLFPSDSAFSFAGAVMRSVISPSQWMPSLS